MANFEVDVDTSQVEQVINSVDFKMRSGVIPARLENKVNNRIVKAQKSKYVSLHDKNNMNSFSRAAKQPSILRNFHYGKLKNGTGTYISNRSFWVGWLEHGALIVPRKEKYCTFVYKGKFHKVNTMVLKAKPIFYNTAEEIWNSTLATDVMNKEMQAIIDRYCS